MPKDFARRVAETYNEKGAGTALIELYAGGWEVVFMYIGEKKRMSIRQVMTTRRYESEKRRQV